MVIDKIKIGVKFVEIVKSEYNNNLRYLMENVLKNYKKKMRGKRIPGEFWNKENMTYLHKWQPYHMMALNHVEYDRNICYIFALEGHSWAQLQQRLLNQSQKQAQ